MTHDARDRKDLSAPRSSAISQRWALAVALALAALGAAFRAQLNFATDIAPAMDAGYYPMQAWWLLEYGRPMYDDVPFFFIVNAVAGKVLALLGGMELGEALLLASRWIDCIVPSLIALPIVLLAHAWSGGARAGLAIGALVAAAAIANPLTLRMLGDFQKNSMALVFLAAAAWAVHRAAVLPVGRGPLCVLRRFWPLALFASLCAFTHVGGFGAAAVMLGATAVAWFALSGGITIRKLALGVAGCAVVSALAFLVVAIFAPDRADDLLDAPRRLFGGSGTGSAQGPAMGGPMGGGPGGDGGGGTIVVYAIAILALARSVFDRSLAAGDRALGIGLAACAMLLACPLISGEYASRFALMSFAPASLACVLVLAPLARTPRRSVVGVAGSCVAAALAIAPVVHGLGAQADARDARRPDSLVKAPVIPTGSDAELRSMRPLIAEPGRTLVVARHGLQWWAGHYLHTPVRNTIPEDAFTKYDRVIRLVEVRGMGPEGRGGGRGGFDPFDGPRAGDRPPGPPEFDGPGQPRDMARPRVMDTPMGRPRPGNVPREEPPRAAEPSPDARLRDIPPSPARGDRRNRPDTDVGGTVLFEGEHFRLIEVTRALPR